MHRDGSRKQLTAPQPVIHPVPSCVRTQKKDNLLPHRSVVTQSCMFVMARRTHNTRPLAGERTEHGLSVRQNVIQPQKRKDAPRRLLQH